MSEENKKYIPDIIFSEYVHKNIDSKIYFGKD